MNKWVSTSEKRSFLKWFLEQHRLKRTDARIILEYILKNHHILENISFSNKVKVSGRSIVISSMNSDEIGFRFYNAESKTEDVSKALTSLMLNPTDKVYLILHFHGKLLNQRYTQLVGHSGLENLRRNEQFNKYSKEADAIIEKVFREQEIQKIKQQIDEALDLKDAALFESLVQKLKKLENHH
ncbi:YpiB family protein [Caldalkalibacillus mannanilyticus]|uniref:YpiB family protein n=1 Tax=Caldalkalibacillus mannanilyticus TaxID=1418 RepID=UPI00046897E1|nr:YpiB family protein [Caldalkalibacillus mannanilyticus]